MESDKITLQKNMPTGRGQQRRMRRKQILSCPSLKNRICHSLLSRHNNSHPFHMKNTITPKVSSAPNLDVVIDVKSRGRIRFLSSGCSSSNAIPWEQFFSSFFIFSSTPLLPSSCWLCKPSRVGVQTGERQSGVECLCLLLS